MAMAQNPKMNRKGGGLKAAMGNLGKGKIPPELIAKLMAMRQGGGMPGGMNAQTGPMPQGGGMPPMMGRR